MYFWSWNPQYLLLQGIVIVFSTLTGVQSQDNKIVGELTITPEKTEPNRDVTLRCTFNLTKDETTLLYWNDKRGHTLYFYQKGKNITVGPEYKNSISNIKTDAGDHSLSLRVTGCNNSPYKCDVWMENSELILDKSIEIEHIASPVVFRDGKAELGDIEIPDNRTYTLLCKVPEATMEHNLTMVVEINGNVSVMNPSPRASSYNSTTCLYSCSLQKDYFLYTSDEVKVTCMAHYKEGKKKTTVSGTPGLGESKMLDMPIIIIIVVFAVIILIGIFTLAVVMCVKKKKGWYGCSKIRKCCCCLCMMDCEPEGKGPLKVNHDFQYSAENGANSEKTQNGYDSPKVDEESNGYTSLEGKDEGVSYVNVPSRSTESNTPQHKGNNQEGWLDHPVPPQRPDRPENPLNVPSIFIPSGPCSL